MSHHVQGAFDVKRTAMETIDAGNGAAFGRFRFEKHFHGDLEASSVVEMLSAGDPATGSAGSLIGSDSTTSQPASRNRARPSS